MRSPAIATLFPYTTLFRSRAHAGEEVVEPLDLSIRRHRERQDRPLEFLDPRRRRINVLRVVDVELLAGLRAAARQDRKSTRLNSSHLVISYAVFSLKEKRR